MNDFFLKTEYAFKKQIALIKAITTNPTTNNHRFNHELFCYKNDYAFYGCMQYCSPSTGLNLYSYRLMEFYSIKNDRDRIDDIAGLNALRQGLDEMDVKLCQIDDHIVTDNNIREQMIGRSNSLHDAQVANISHGE